MIVTDNSLKKRLVTLCAVALLIAPVFGQLKTYLTLETGPHWSYVKTDDPGNYFEPSRAIGTMAGLTIEQEIFVVADSIICSKL